MKPLIFALLTAAAWGVGGYFEKKGLALGKVSPQVGITIRTAVAFLILGAFSCSQWRQIPEAGPKAILCLVLGGGVLAGSVGMLCFYSALHGAPIGQVMPLAFTAPLFGALMGILFGGEPATFKAMLGMAFIIAGIFLLSNR